tara:strand:- start:17580 stop:17900 length:321 start_codon:yes stop_codon:yes gene_type:complete
MTEVIILLLILEIKKMKIEELIKNPEINIIDVRTPGEFVTGNVPESINIPLDEIIDRIDEIRVMQPVVLCCASGNRSGQAKLFLQSNGLEEVYNGGGWEEVLLLKG